MAAWNPRANEIFLQAVEAEAGPSRAALVDSACGDDAELRRQVEALLKAHVDAGSFLDHPPAAGDTPDGEVTVTRAERAEGEGHSLDFLDAPQRDGSIGRLKNYEVQSVVGSGGMGVVLKAVDESLDRVVAIKVLSPHYAANATARKRFVREAKAVAAVTHDHVVTVHAVGDESDPVPYLVMQYVQGISLQDRIDRGGPLELKEVLRIGTQIARGLAAAHAQGIIHRDIKPANILLENGVERVKITDFGLARTVDDASVTQSGVIAGTPMFMSPEQAAGETVDPRSDLFSLGSVLYVMGTGHAPFRASGTMAVMKRVMEDTPRPVHEINPEMPSWLDAIIAKLHAKKPVDRFQSAKEVADLLEQHLAHLQQPHLVARPEPVRVPATETPASTARMPLALKIAIPLIITICVYLTIMVIAGFLVGIAATMLSNGILLLLYAARAIIRARQVDPDSEAATRRRRRWLLALGVLATPAGLALLSFWLSKPLRLYIDGNFELVVNDLQPEFDEFRVEAIPRGQSTTSVGNVTVRNFQQWKIKRGQPLVLPPGGYYVEAVGRNGERVTRWRLEDSTLFWGYETTVAENRCRIAVARGHRVRLSIANWERRPDVVPKMPNPPAPLDVRPAAAPPLDGRWVLVAAEYQGKPVNLEEAKQIPSEITFNGERYDLAIRDQRHEGALKVDPTKLPAEMNLTGPAFDKLNPRRAIYELTENNLKLCFAFLVANADPPPRPTSFTTDAQSSNLVLTYRREPPP